MPVPAAPQPFVKTWLLPALLGVLVLALLLWANLNFSNTVGAGMDFLHRWLPARLLLTGVERNPYAESASLAIQQFRYGRPALPNEAPGLFAYPYYTLIFILPFALIKDFTIARALWMTLLELAHIAVIFLSLRLCHFQPRRLTLLLLLGFALFSADLIVPLVEGNPASLTALLLVLCLFFLQQENDVAAGICLALATIKPQMTILFFGLVWLWAFSRKRWRVLIASSITLAVLMGVSFLFLPEWLGEFIRQLRIYPSYAQPNTPQEIFSKFLPGAAIWISRALTLASLLLLGINWFRVWKQDFPALLWTACLTFAVQPLSGIASTRSNLVALLPAVILITAVLASCWQRRVWRVDLLLAALLILSWVLMIGTRQLLVGGMKLAYFDLLPLPVLVIAGLLALRNIQPFDAQGE